MKTAAKVNPQVEKFRARAAQSAKRSLRTKRYQNREVNRNRPTKTQCNRIIASQLRRADLTPEQRKIRQMELRAMNGHMTPRMMVAVICDALDSLEVRRSLLRGHRSGRITVNSLPIPSAAPGILFPTWNDYEEGDLGR